MDHAKIIKASILTLIMIVLIGGYYYYLSTRNAKINSQANAEEQAVEMTAVQELIARASFKEYPTTPVQVVKYYNEITSCFYNETYSDDELVKLAQMSLALCDSELVANQTFDEYISSLRKDISVFNSGNITVYSSEVTPATDVEYFSHNGYECARLYSIYTLKSGTVYQTTKEIYILRKDEKEHWKIFGFALAKEED